MEPGEEKTIVVVDDEEPMRDYLREVLTHEGYDCRCFTGSLAALSYMASSSERTDLVLTDINMPGMGGVDLLRTVKTVSPELPVILISDLYEVGLAIEALKGGAADYLLKPAQPEEVARLVARHLEPDHEGQREAMRGALRKFLSLRDRYDKPGEQVQEVFDVLGFKRYETLQHSKRVAAYAILLGEVKDLSTEDLGHLELGALLHDIGKIAIPHNVLMKPEPLNDEEWVVMKLHPQIGWELLSEFPELGAEAEIVYSHHERFDGKGYPRRLKGHDIPLSARIFSIVDTLDAITSDRPYRSRQPLKAARAEIKKRSGSQFDPSTVRPFFGCGHGRAARWRTVEGPPPLPGHRERPVDGPPTRSSPHLMADMNVSALFVRAHDRLGGERKGIRGRLRSCSSVRPASVWEISR